MSVTPLTKAQVIEKVACELLSVVSVDDLRYQLKRNEMKVMLLKHGSNLFVDDDYKILLDLIAVELLLWQKRIDAIYDRHSKEQEIPILHANRNINWKTLVETLDMDGSSHFQGYVIQAQSKWEARDKIFKWIKKKYSGCDEYDALRSVDILSVEFDQNGICEI